MKCPQCNHEWVPTGAEIAAELGKRSSSAKTKAARENAKLGGWPKGRKRKPTIIEITTSPYHHEKTTTKKKRPPIPKVK